jgi:putative chitinase
MLIALIDRLTGLLRPATAAAGDSHPAPHEFGAAPEQVAGKPGLVSPITIGLLEALGVRHALAVQYAPLLAIAAHRYQIDATPRRVAAWLATIAHESARLTAVVENLNYSAQGLAQTWPARYADMIGQPTATALRIARRQKDIANLTYAGRLGNGSAGSGDGWRYRGRGLIQITGRSNYAASGIALGLPDLIDSPWLLEQPHYAALSAAEWWHRHGCNQRADTGDLADVTRRVNGGLTGLDDRLKLYAAAMGCLGSA